MPHTPSSHPDPSATQQLHAHIAGLRSSYLRSLQRMVAIDCGSWNAAGVNEVGGLAGELLQGIGFSVDRIPVPNARGRRLGDAVIARRMGRLDREAGGRVILLLAHLDTVFPDGTARERSFHIDGDLAYGPGVTDDKAGVLSAITAARALVETGREHYAELIIALTPDEEIGSPGSRPLIERLAQAADYALCLECARENGDIVQARKGVVDLRVRIKGTAAHAGVEPERGANAALAAARLIVAIEELNLRNPGVSINTAVIRAGTRPNVVCDLADIELEVRAETLAALLATQRDIENLANRCWVKGTTTTVTAGELCPPMESTSASRAMAATAAAVANNLGFGFEAVRTGGVADANYVSSCGTPTLDGLGPVGGADHSPGEWLDLSSVVPRTTMVADLITRLGSGHLAAEAAPQAAETAPQ